MGRFITALILTFVAFPVMIIAGLVTYCKTAPCTYSLFYSVLYFVTSVLFWFSVPIALLLNLRDWLRARKKT